MGYSNNRPRETWNKKDVFALKTDLALLKSYAEMIDKTLSSLLTEIVSVSAANVRGNSDIIKSLKKHQKNEFRKFTEGQ